MKYSIVYTYVSVYVHLLLHLHSNGSYFYLVDIVIYLQYVHSY